MTTQSPIETADTTAVDQRFAMLVSYLDDSEPIDDYVHFMVDSNVIVIKGGNARFFDRGVVARLSYCLDLKGTELPRFNQTWGAFPHGLESGQTSCIWTHLTIQVPESASSIDDFGPIEMPTSAILALKIEFDAAKDEEFEDGMESSFSTALETVIRRYGDVALKAIADILTLPDIGAGAITETLRQLGNIVHIPSRQLRKEILLKYLDKEELKFRDAAALGLGGLDDPSAIPKLREALEHESHGLLKRKIQAVLTQLDSIQR